MSMHFEYFFVFICNWQTTTLVLILKLSYYKHKKQLSRFKTLFIVLQFVCLDLFDFSQKR